MAAKKAYKVSVLLVERGDSVAALACHSEESCAVGRGASAGAAAERAIAALERGEGRDRAEAKALMREADDVWSADFKRQALGAAKTRRRRKR